MLNFKKEHHKKIAVILDNINKDFLIENKIFFAGGTYLSLLINEYRNSVDVDFITSNDEGYKILREKIIEDKEWNFLFHQNNKITIDSENIKR